MRTVEFGDFLLRQGLTQKGVRARIAWCRRVEKDFQIDLDLLCCKEEAVQELRRRVYDHPDYTPRQRRNFPNAVKKYFEFCTGRELPRLGGA